MRLILTTCAAAALTLAGGGASVAQVADSADVDVTAKFVQTLSVAGANALNFGTATTPSAPATIAISPSGSRSTNNGGGLTLLNTSGNTGNPATFSISANGGDAFSLEFDHLSAPAGYALSDYRVSGCSVPAETATSTTLSGTGLQTCTLSVGATLSVPAGANGTQDLGQLQATVTYH